MAFMALIVGMGLFLVSLFGGILCIVGIILLIIYFVKKKKIFLIVSIVVLVLGIPMVLSYPVITTKLTDMSINDYIDPAEYPVVNAAYKGDSKKLKKLLEEGKDPNEIFDETPAIFWAVNKSGGEVSCEVAEELIKYGVDIHLKNEEGYSLMKYILINGTPGGDNVELLKIVKLLLENGYDANETDKSGISLLMYAMLDSSFNGETEIANSLIEKGARINAVDNQGRTALMWACATSGKKDTPRVQLRGYANRVDHDIVKLLIDKGAEIKAVDKNGYRALDYFKMAKEKYKKENEEEYARNEEDYIKIGELLKDR